MRIPCRRRDRNRKIEGKKIKYTFVGPCVSGVNEPQTVYTITGVPTARTGSYTTLSECAREHPSRRL